MKTKSHPAKGRPRAFDPEQALDRAMRVFWSKGYVGASLSDLTEAMGINRPSLYAAFGNKESLFRLALEHYGKGPASFLQQALDQPTARKVAETILFLNVEMLTDPSTPGGCLSVRGALELRGLFRSAAPGTRRHAGPD
ncbi:MAG: TetR/AcrR family transcriptional regulator [Chthoniobacteraceae bacterium]